MNGPDLFEQMYAEDKEGQKLNEMPGLEDQLHRYPFLLFVIKDIQVIDVARQYMLVSAN
jgi:hypothetical protein